MEPENSTPETKVNDTPETAITNGMAMVHPAFMSETGQPLPPPPGHKYAVVVMMSLGQPDQPMPVPQIPVWISSKTKEGIVSKIQDILFSSIARMEEKERLVQPATPEQAEALKAMAREGAGGLIRGR